MQSSQSVIILLLVANLVATIWFGLNKEVHQSTSVAENAATHELPPVVNSETHELPPVVNSETRVNLYNKFAKAFNAANYDALYDMFGPAAKAQFTKETAFAEFGKLTKFFHSVESGAFTHSELAGTKGNTNFYVLYYVVKLHENSEFGTSGTLKITVAVQGSEYQVYGIRLNAG